MAIFTIQVTRPIVAKIIRGVSLKTSRMEQVERTIERAIAIPKGLYTMTRKRRSNVIHLYNATTGTKQNAFIDDYNSLRSLGTLQVVKVHRAAK